MKSTSFFFLLGCILLVALSGCYYDNYEELHPSLAATNCDTTKIMSYANDVVPILNASCGINNSCHGPGTSNVGGGDLASYASVFTSTQNTLLSSITWDGNTPSLMPKGSSVRIPVCDITKIKKWIDNGAPNN